MVRRSEVILIACIIMVFASTGGIVNSTNHFYHMSIEAGAGNLNVSDDYFTVAIGLPSTKNLTTTNHIYSYGMLSAHTIWFCEVISGPGIIISQDGTYTNLTIVVRNISASTNITCGLQPVDGNCPYYATNVTFINFPYSSTNALTACPVHMITNSSLTTNESQTTRSIHIYVGYTMQDWGKIISGAGATISIIGIFIGYRHTTEEL